MADPTTSDIAARLRALPGMRRVPSAALELLMLPKFLDAAACDALIARIEADRRPSTIADANGDPTFRTSETCDLPADDPAAAALAARLAGITGLDPACAEPLQGQRYAPGQEFKAHTDYFEPDGPDFARFCTVSGQRTWTLMIYLNDVPAGGGTRFLHLDKIVQPERGKLLAWNNRRPDGSVNPATVHHGMKVRRGVKHIVTAWFRERPWG